MDYQKYIEKLINLKIIKRDDVFFFDSTPHEDAFQKIFDFYIETLNINSVYGISPAYIFFKNDTSRNAKAGKINGQFIIQINAGTVIYLIQQFNPGQSNPFFKELKLDERKIGTDINTLLYQFAIHFTFYHEMAHLIQKSDVLENGFVNLSEFELPYNEDRHLKELDADAFSALCLSAHVIQLFENNYGDDAVFSEFKELAILMCSTGINYVLSFNGMQKDLYYYETTHPHPIIRISCILNHMLEYAQQYFSSEVLTHEIRREIQSGAFEWTEKILNDITVKQFKEKYSKNVSEIMNYITHFRQLEVKDQTLALFKWNKLIELEQR